MAYPSDTDDADSDDEEGCPDNSSCSSTCDMDTSSPSPPLSATRAMSSSPICNDMQDTVPWSPLSDIDPSTMCPFKQPMELVEVSDEEEPPKKKERNCNRLPAPPPVPARVGVLLNKVAVLPQEQNKLKKPKKNKKNKKKTPPKRKTKVQDISVKCAPFKNLQTTHDDVNCTLVNVRTSGGHPLHQRGQLPPALKPLPQRVGFTLSGWSRQPWAQTASGPTCSVSTA